MEAEVKFISSAFCRQHVSMLHFVQSSNYEDFSFYYGFAIYIFNIPNISKFYFSKGFPCSDLEKLKNILFLVSGEK